MVLDIKKTNHKLCQGLAHTNLCANNIKENSNCIKKKKNNTVSGSQTVKTTNISSQSVVSKLQQ